jgi:hypothetical protein
VVFYGVEIFVSFSSVWDACVANGHKMTMWQGNCQMKCGRQKSRDGVTKG